jgi:hypothetical protein
LNDEGNEGEVTVLLKQLAGGNPQALGELVPMVYEQLHAIALNRPGSTGDSTR